MGRPLNPPSESRYKGERASLSKNHFENGGKRDGHARLERHHHRHRRSRRGGSGSGTTSRSFWNAIGGGDRPSSSLKTYHHSLNERGLGENDLPFPQRASAIGKKSHEPDVGGIFATELLHCCPRLCRVRLRLLKLNNTQMKGGTGWTVEFAKQLGRPIYAYDLLKQQWYRYNIHTKTFHRMGGGYFPLLYKKSAIVGARIAEGYPWVENGPGRLIRTDPGLPRTPNPQGGAHGGTLRGSHNKYCHKNFYCRKKTLPQTLLFFT